MEMYLQRDNGNGGLLVYDGNKKWYYFDASEIPHSIIYPKKAIAADNEIEKIDAMLESIRNAIYSGDLYSAEDFIHEYENDEKYHVEEYDGLTIVEIEEIENYEISDCGDRVPKNHDTTYFYKI